MCGISGAVGLITPEIVLSVERMDSAQVHRGPDGRGQWSSVAKHTTDHGVVFAHRRLAIIDLTAAGIQPMADPDTGNVVVFNGEIYNYIQLREQLSREYQQTFHTRTDTEVLLKSYAAWGKDCVHRLRGMFAFALFDASTRTTLLVRDRLGVKPLYYHQASDADANSILLFASELRALLESGIVPRKLDPESVAAYLWNGFVQGPQTIVKGIQELPAGTFLTVEENGRSTAPKKYWKLPRPLCAEIDCTEQLERELREAVSLRMISDVPVGIFLSGGIDSSAVAAMAISGGHRQVRTFNIAFDQPEFDESSYARTVADSLGTQHTELVLSESMFSGSLDEAMNCLDQPTIDGINTYFVSRLVREAGVTVALAGTGGDELFGGYRSFVDIPRAVRWSRRMSFLPPRLVSAGLSGFLHLLSGSSLVPPQTRWGKVSDLVAARGDLIRIYQTTYSLFTRDYHRQLFPSATGDHNWGLTAGQYADWSGLVDQKNAAVSELAAISNLELTSFIGQRLLRDTDCASMAVSLEVRVPLLDHRVVEEAFQLSERRRFQPVGSKSLLRKLALSGLKAEIFDRPKSGFVLPFERWIRSSLRDTITESLSDRDLLHSVGLDYQAVTRLHQAFNSGEKGMYWSRIWVLFVLIWWARRHKVQL